MTMTSTNSKISADARQAGIRELLMTNDEVSICTLASRFGVSEMTIRRDLDKLEQTGQVIRTHGGAMPAERMGFEFDFASRRQANRESKRIIAEKAAQMVRPGQRLILDTGTTTLELAAQLKDMSGITVITPSLAVASVLQFSHNIETVLLGGVIRKGSPDLTGVVTEHTLEMFAADIAFQGADGIGDDGTMYNADIRIANVDLKIRQRAQKTYVLCDSSKIGVTSLAANGDVSEVDAFITDDGIDRKLKEKFERMGAKIIIATNKQQPKKEQIQEH